MSQKITEKYGTRGIINILLALEHVIERPEDFKNENYKKELLVISKELREDLKIHE